MTTLLVWSQLPGDERGTASALSVFYVRHGTAKRHAERIDFAGQRAADQLISTGAIVPEISNKGQCAQGHGVTVQYPSGQVRTYRGQ